MIFQSDVSSQLQCVRRQAMDAASEAAHRSGIPVEQWLEAAIINRAAADGVHLRETPHLHVADQQAAFNERVLASLNRLSQRLAELLPMLESQARESAGHTHYAAPMRRRV